MLGLQQPPCRKGCCQAQGFRRMAVEGGSEECECVQRKSTLEEVGGKIIVGVPLGCMGTLTGPQMKLRFG